jgi:glycerol-3-phosphate acyltransferase PlsY
MIQRLLCLLVGYLCGCLLTADIVARHVAKRSIFELGDGNPGMANVGHELGTPAAIVCLAGDILKTLLPVLVMSRLFPQLGWAVATGWTGLGATLGHILPFWHGFRGGKGVTTIASTIILMNPLWGILAGVVGVATIILSGYLSVAAVVAMGFYVLAAAFTLPIDCTIISLVFWGMQFMTHASKLRGIRTGTTHRASLSTKFWAKVRGK